MPRKALNNGRYKNVTVDADIIALLNGKAEELDKQLGFRPTVSQTLRYILKKEAN